MSDPDAPLITEAERDALRAAVGMRRVDEGRIDILYRLGRHYLFLPFAALCLAGVLYKNLLPIWIAIVPLILQIATTVATGRLAERYRRHKYTRTPQALARTFTWYSAFSGAAWGTGAVIWFDTVRFPPKRF